RLGAACGRGETALEALPGGGASPAPGSARAGGTPAARAGGPRAAEPALAHLHGLEHALAELAAPLRPSSASRLAGA
ncbi:hypothetical protein ABZ038_39845, partial [Streptomyces sp. NPDC006349]